MHLAAKVFHGLATTDAIVSSADKITGPFATFVAHTPHGSRVNGCRFFQFERIEHQLQAHSYRQDDYPQVALAAIVTAAFIESGEEGPQTGLMQAEEVIFSRFPNQFLREGQGDHLTV
ncbi:MAG: hypothetical protein PVSMB2_36280 [Ktedonobacteraceae bacterium]